MTTRARRLFYAFGSLVGLAAILWFFFGSIGPAPEETLQQPGTEPHPVAHAGRPEVPHGTLLSAHTPNVDSSPDSPNDPIEPGGVPTRRYVNYAIGLHELQGLAPDADPGARLALWAAWDPPLVEEPRVQMLIEEAVLVKTIPPTLPEGPYTAVISVRRRDVPQLLYGEQWGRLSVVMLDT